MSIKTDVLTPKQAKTMDKSTTKMAKVIESVPSGIATEVLHEAFRVLNEKRKKLREKKAKKEVINKK